MKNAFILLLIISGLSTWANTKNDDLTRKSHPTTNACSFTNNSTFNCDSITDAIALRDYQYYVARYNKAHDRKIIGLALIGGSVITAIIGYRLFSKNIFADNNLSTKGIAIHFTGIAMFNIGVPLFAWGETEQNRNKEVLEKCKQSKTSLHIAPTENGIGLVLTF